MTTAALLLAALSCTAAAALLPWVWPARRYGAQTVAFLLLAAAMALLAVAGVRAVLGAGGTVDLGDWVGFGPAALVVDRLSGLFLTLIGAVGVPVTVGFTAWARDRRNAPFRSLPSIVALTTAGIVLVLTADSAYLFLFGWESVSVAFYLLTGYRRDLSDTARPSMVTFAFSKISGSLLLLALLLLAAESGSFLFSDWSTVRGPAHAVAYVLALTAFTAKVGVVPLQVWLPGGYGAAPGPARALMSAVAANIGFYGMWRTLQVLGAPPVWLAVVLLLAASFTALLGIAHAAVQRDLQRVIAYSSVENGGLITAGYAIALAGAATGEPRLVALGLLTATLQMVAHSLAKSGLFLSAARIEQVTGERDLDRLVGAGRREPVVGTAFAIGAMTLAALPLTVGFVSEWFLLESVMQLFRLQGLTLQLSFATAGALLALAVGYAGFTFVRLVGMTVLGTPRSPADREAPGRLGWLAGVAVLAPAASCVVLAALSPLEIRFLAQGLSPVVPSATTAGALSSPWVLQPVFADFSALSPSWLAVELPLLALATLAGVTLLSRGTVFRVRRVPAWRSATGGVTGDAHYTPFAFANPTRHVLGNLLLTRSGRIEVERETSEEEAAASTFTGPDLPEGQSAPHVPPSAHHLTYTTDVVELVEAFLYQPVVRPARRLVAAAKRLQSGRLDAYIGYMLITLVALLAVVVTLS